MNKMIMIVTAFAVACGSAPAERHSGRTTRAIGTTIVVGPDCTIQQAALAANSNQPVAGCPAGTPGNQNQDIIQIPSGTHAPTARVTFNESVALLGDCSAWPVVDMGMRDRFMLVPYNNPTVEVACIDFRNVCPNGGPCNQIVGGSVPTGGVVYWTTGGDMHFHDFSVQGGLARAGCGIGICNSTPNPLSAVVESFEIAGCVAMAGGGGAVNAHVDVTLRDGYLHGNRTQNGGHGGNIYLYGGAMVLEDMLVEGGIDAGWNANGGNIAATNGARYFLTGTTTVTGGADQTPNPIYAPDCFGQVTVGPNAHVGNPAGCTITYE